jgi:hypothetical protein
MDHDVVSHDHLVAFVEEGDPVLARVEHVPQSEDATTQFLRGLDRCPPARTNRGVA